MNYCQSFCRTIQRLCNANSGGGEDLTPLLPEEYQQVEYLQSSGAQQINTNIDVSADNIIEITIYTSGSGTNDMVMGSTDNEWRVNTIGYNFGRDKYFYSCPSKRYEYTYRGKLYIIASKNSVSVNGFNISSSSTTYGVGGIICLFSCYSWVNYNGRFYGSIKLYSLTISNGGNVLGKFIPCYRKLDNKPGLYELVTQDFLTNVGTGADFTVGRDTESVPSAYQQVAYIVSTGAQYIDTGLYVTPYTAVTMDMQCTTVNTQTRLFSTEYGTGVRFGAYISGSRYWSYIYNNTGTYTNTGAGANTYRHIITLDGYNQNFQVDYSIQSTFTRPSATSTNTLCLLAVSTSGENGLVGKLYGCQVYDNNILIRDYKPCYRKSDNKPGVYDVVTHTFLTNAGTGADFTVGNNL